MVNSLLLVGVGELGSRHLQGLVQCQSALNIIAVDPSRRAREIAQLRWRQAGGNNTPHKVFWSDTLPGFLTEVDLAIVATSSKGRASLVAAIAKAIRVRFWVLEKVLAQSSAEIRQIVSAVETSDGVWVNTPRRMMPWHKSILQNLFGTHRMHGDLSGGLWGLACNSIHFLDLISWWSGEELSSLDIEDLSCDWFESKRAGNFEVTGTLVAKFLHGSSLVLRSCRDVNSHSLVVELDDGTNWEIDEKLGFARSSAQVRIDGRLELQSELSGKLVEEILSEGACDLPSLSFSADMHSIFLDAMLQHWNISTGRNDEVVPIT